MARAKVKSTSSDLTARLMGTLNTIRPKKEDKGTYTVGRSTEDSPTKVRYVVTTGIRAFDDRVGGMPVGKTIELVGLPQSGKTNMAVRTCVRAQQGFVYERVQTSDGRIALKKLKPGTYDITTLYYDNEGSLSDFDKRRIDGTVMDGLIIPCDTVELLWKTMERVIQEVDKEEEDTGRIQILIVVIDTVGIMSTAMEMEKEFGKIDYPRVPKQLKDGFKRMTGKMMRENVLLIGLNHVSKKMNQGFSRGAPGVRAWDYQQPGGQAFSYCATHQVYFETLQVKYRLVKKGSAEGYLVYFCTTKNRLKPPLRESRMSLLFTIKDDEKGVVVREGGFNDEFSILEALIFDKAAEVKSDGTGIAFKFNKFGVPTTTFSKGEATPSLESLDEEDEDDPPKRQGRFKKAAAKPKRLRDPRIAIRAEWPAFYQEHREDLDALYDRVTQLAVSLTDLKGAYGDDDDDDDEETL